MQKGVFTTWIKELCSLVFVQTIQAFILAIVLSIIVTFLVPQTTDAKALISDQNTVSALGVLCIILLTSLTKMEQITKKIFGLESGILQDKPPHGLMTSMLALKAAGRVLNNVPKIATGIGRATLGAGLDKKKAMNNNMNRLKHAGLDKDGKPLEGEKLPEASEGDAGSSLDSLSNKYYEEAKKAKSSGNKEELKRNMAIQYGINEAKKAMATKTPQPTSNKKNIDANKDVSKDYWKMMDKYDDEISKAKEKRRKGIEDIASGLAETVGAGAGMMAGGSIGLVSGLATNDLDQIPKAMGVGIGAGDVIGESLTKATSAAISNTRDRVKTTSSLNKNLSQMEKNLNIEKNNRKRSVERFKDVQKAYRESHNISDV